MDVSPQAAHSNSPCRLVYVFQIKGMEKAKESQKNSKEIFAYSVSSHWASLTTFGPGPVPFFAPLQWCEGSSRSAVCTTHPRTDPES